MPADSGVQKTVCPDSYYRKQSNPTTIPTENYAGEFWAAPGPNPLNIKCSFRFFEYGPSTWSASNLLLLNLYGGSGIYPWVFQYQYITGTSRSDVNLNFFMTQDYLNGITPTTNPANIATRNNYLIRDWQFGSHFVSGVTYTWSRGNGW